MIKIRSSANTAIIPALAGALVCLFLMRSGLLALLFLLPLGFIGYGWGPKTLWYGLGFAILGNLILSLGLGLIAGVSAGAIVWEILYFTIMTAAFAWVILPLDEKSAGIPGSMRLAIGGCLGTLVFVALFNQYISNESFNEEISNQFISILALYQPANAVDAVRNALDAQAVEGFIGMVKNIILRGGALFSCVLVFFLNRQISVLLIRLFGGPRRANVFLNFHTHQKLIWILAGAGLVIPVTSLLSMTTLGIIAWNIITLCAMMYLAQGLGIIAFFLAKPNFPVFLRFLIPVLFVILIFNPSINMMLVGAIILLGIVENWVSFRTLKIRSFNGGPPSTPEV